MNVIDYYKAIPLTGEQVLKLVNNNANLVLYSDLHKYDNVDDVLGQHGACFILFEWKKGVGHWCCLCLRGKTLYFFNSYSGYPDDSLKKISKDFRDKSNQDFPYLSKLLYDSPYRLGYNEFKFQGKGGTVMTCGRWCALFILLKDVPLNKFAKLFKSKYGDDIVTALTMWVNIDQ
jgi:hypothetical protein